MGDHRFCSAVFLRGLWHQGLRVDERFLTPPGLRPHQAGQAACIHIGIAGKAAACSAARFSLDFGQQRLGAPRQAIGQ
jgi:hypothetical protein